MVVILTKRKFEERRKQMVELSLQFDANSRKEDVFNEHQFEYFTLDHNLNPELPNFGYTIIGPNKDDYFVGVSNAIPIGYRKYIAGHEYMEGLLQRENGDSDCLCQEVSELELKIARAELEEEDFLIYRKLRKLFFKNLVGYATDERGYSQFDRDKFRKSQELF